MVLAFATAAPSAMTSNANNSGRHSNEMARTRDLERFMNYFLGQ